MTDRSITIVLPRLLPGLNGKDGLIRKSKYIKANMKLKEAIFYQIREQVLYLQKPELPVRAVLRRFYKVHPMDWDNAASSFKYLLDAIVDTKLIPDDKIKVIQSITCEQHKVHRKEDERMEVTFIPVNNEEPNTSDTVFL